MRRLSLTLALVLVFAGCGDDATTTPSDTTTPVTTTTSGTATTVFPTTTDPSTTTSSGPTTTDAPSTTAPGPFYSVAGYGLFPEPLLTPADGHGSGCAPPGDLLPDGIWFGYARAIALGELTFDLACFFTGDAAVAAAAADGGEAFDFYIRNHNPKLFSVGLFTGGTAYWIDATAADVTPLPIAMTAWPVDAGYVSCPGEFCGVWLFVNDGLVTELVEQFTP